VGAAKGWGREKRRKRTCGLGVPGIQYFRGMRGGDSRRAPSSPVVYLRRRQRSRVRLFLTYSRNHPSVMPALPFRRRLGQLAVPGFPASSYLEAQLKATPV
jgi:hypothetical protein